ncbi:glycoside hydrolase family 49 protein [Xylona heveae TC161]|uniref:Glycoside hydrolase family 49 protein n=1 Tax=Xylona heveae (strain CBS 132557 / TC161) TaxID=1328760 RepID=A0A164ZGP9_XYLHT|nr:glycoside hydrolase family 49 protein [Xylona heveae TC161]KZF19085.1 glycoside hydrolase family 49 protein [Xylona heveae TC161]
MPVVGREPLNALLIFASPFPPSDMVPLATEDVYYVKPGLVTGLEQIKMPSSILLRAYTGLQAPRTPFSVRLSAGSTMHPERLSKVPCNARMATLAPQGVWIRCHFGLAVCLPSIPCG